MSRTGSLVVFLTLALSVGSVWAQTPSTVGPPADTMKVDYFSNANTSGAPDATVRLDDPGSPTGNVCASMFVFDQYQELSECCSCLLTPDGLRTLSVNNDVTANPLTGVTLNTGVIKFVSTTPIAGTCPLPTVVRATPTLRAWTTHIQNGNFSVTETASSDVTLNTGEASRLARECYAVWLVGSGRGICSCGKGD